MRSRQWLHRLYCVVAGATLFVILGAGSVSAQDRDDRDDKRRRERDYIRAMFGPAPLIRITANTVIDQWQDNPDDWDQDVAGFAQRFGSNAGARWVNVSVRHGIAALQDRTTEYKRCECTSTVGRIRQAVLGSVTDFDERGNRHFSVAQVSGAIAGSSAKIIWTPDYDASNAARGTIMSLSITAAGNLIREFILK